MNDSQPKRESVIVDVDFARLDLSFIWYLVKNAPVSSKVTWLVTFIVIALCKLIRRPVWSPLWGAVEYTWAQADQETVARVMKPKAREMESFLSEQGFHPLLDYTTPVLFNNIISRLFLNPATKTYALIHISKPEIPRKSCFLEFRTIFDDLYNVATIDSKGIGLPRYERALHYYHHDLIPEALLQRHISHLQSPELAGHRVLPNPSAEQYFEFMADSNPPYVEFMESKGLVRRRTKELAKTAGALVIPKVCEWHPGVNAIAMCTSCGKPVCVSCLKRRSRASYCVECAEAVPQSALIGYQPSGFMRRLGAFLIDGLAIILIWYALSRLVEPFSSNPAAAEAIGNARGVLGLIFFALAPALYSILLTGRYGRTPGKRITGIKVIADNGQPVTYWDAGVRYVGYLLSFLTAGVGFLIPLWEPHKRALHDKFAETRVVRSNPELVQNRAQEVTHGT